MSREASMNRCIVSAFLLFSLGACTQPTSPILGVVSARGIGQNVEITNHTFAPVYTFVIDRGAAAYTDWGPCTDPTLCAATAPQSGSVLPYSQIVGYTLTSREVIVYWWHLVPDGASGFRADSTRAIIIGL